MYETGTISPSTCILPDWTALTYIAQHVIYKLELHSLHYINQTSENHRNKLRNPDTTDQKPCYELTLHTFQG